MCWVRACITSPFFSFAGSGDTTVKRIKQAVYRREAEAQRGKYKCFTGPRFGKQKSVNSSFPDAVSQAQTPMTPREVWASRPPALREAGIQLAKWWAPSCRTLWGQWEGDGHARPSTSDPEMVARDEGTEIYQGPFPHLQPA